MGLEAEAARIRPWGSLRFGLGLDRLSTSYATRLVAGEGLDHSGDGASFVAAATSWTGFVDHRWIPHDRWLVDNGLRAVAAHDGRLDLEPRASLHYRPRPELTLSAGYARVHQHAQSLRNEESVLIAAFGFDPLVSAADARVPVARSDQLTAAAHFDLAEGLRFEVDAYARRLSDLVLVAPATAHPFAIDSVVRGRGTAKGVGAALFYRGSATKLDLLGEWSTVTRRTPEMTYHPTFQRERSLTAGVARRLGERTSVRAAFRAAAGRPTSGLLSGFEWEPMDLYTGEVELGGTPLRRPGALNREWLPAYVRLDAGVRRAWRLSLLGLEGELVTWLDVLNLLGRRNVLALEERADAHGLFEIPLSGTSITLGVNWSF